VPEASWSGGRPKLKGQHRVWCKFSMGKLLGPYLVFVFRQSRGDLVRVGDWGMSVVWKGGLLTARPRGGQGASG